MEYTATYFTDAVAHFLELTNLKDVILVGESIGAVIALTLVSDLRRVDVAGCEMRYLRTGSGRPIVLLHTLRTQLEYFLPLVDAVGRDCEIVARDLPGHGRSTAPRC